MEAQSDIVMSEFKKRWYSNSDLIKLMELQLGMFENASDEEEWDR